ncbi:MAG: CPBP family intramembrane metalloprotease [Candidatus Marinimicrobia bacterium]|nr:CPBP family intramembrane metalloprotease [Candidatus Neomarinimicrobiota bacterium]
MKNPLFFVKNHPVLTYFTLTFIISWGGIAVLGGPHGIPAPKAQFEALWPVVFLPYFFGPTLSGLLLIGIIHGKEGIKNLLSRFIRWRVDVRWYAIAVLTAPLLVAPLLFILAQISPVYVPAIVTAENKLTLIFMGVSVGLIFGGILEEIGWTGFAVPEMRKEYGSLFTGFMVGILWGIWHIFPTLWGSGDAAGTLSLSLFLPPCLFYVGVLPAYRILMTWVYDNTGSLLINMFMHASLTATTLFIFLPAATGMDLALYYLVLTAIIWLIVLYLRFRLNSLVKSNTIIVNEADV